MSTSTIDSIRTKFTQFVQRQGVKIYDEHPQETILIRDGFYCGRRLTLAGFALTWFVEENQVKLSTAQGQILLSCDLAQFLSAEQPVRRAA